MSIPSRVDTPPAPPRPTARWTILLYSAADNNLQHDMIENITDMEKVGSDSYTNLVAQVDTGDHCNRYLVQKAATPQTDEIQSPSLQDLGPVNMADPKTLSDFIKWGVQKFPAQNYMVIVSDHGNGWQGSVEDDSAGGAFMALPQHRKAFEDGGQHLAILGYDACLMAASEVTREFRGLADYLVVSQETEGSAGWPYSHILSPDMLKNLKEMNFSKIDVGPKELAQLCVKDSAQTQSVLPTMTSVDMSREPALTGAIDGLGKAILATSTPQSVLSDIVNNTQSFTDYKDAFDFAQRISTSSQITDAGLKTAAKGVMNAIKPLNDPTGGVVMTEEHSPSYPGAHGLTLEISTNGVRPGYTDLQFAHDTSWPAALTKLSGQSSQQMSSSAADPSPATPLLEGCYSR